MVLIRASLTAVAALCVVACGEGMGQSTTPPRPVVSPGGGAGGAGGGTPVVTPPGPGPGCVSDAECASGEFCDVSGEFGGACVVIDAGTPWVDAGAPGGGAGAGGSGGGGVDLDGGSNPIDPGCNVATAPDFYPPKWPALPPSVPGTCRTGFEMNNPYLFLAGKTYTIQSKAAQGSGALTLEFDFATYKAPDGLKISGTLANGQKYTLFESCRMQTADYADPTDGSYRPPEDSIRDYRLALRANTVALEFDSTNSSTPTYLKVTGLCGFNLTAALPAMSTQVQWFRPF